MKYDQTRHLKLVYSEDDMLKTLRMTPEEAEKIAPSTLQKGGPGSGRKRLITSYLDKLENSKTIKGSKTSSGKDMAISPIHGTEAGYSAQDHKDAGDYHHKVSESFSNMSAKPGISKEESEAFKTVARKHANLRNSHLSQAERMETRKKKP